jgi:hypothetical protein
MIDANDAIRQSVLVAVNARGARQVAEAVGVHPQTLQKYLKGGIVRADVLWKLEAWQRRSSARVEVHRGQGVLYGSDA